MSISGNRSLLSSGSQEFVHLTDAPNLVTRGVDGEDEDEDDSEEHSGMGAVLQKSQDTLGVITEVAQPH